MCGLIIDKQWIFEDDIHFIDRLFVIQYKTNIVIIIDIPHNDLSTLLFAGLTVKFYGFKLNDNCLMNYKLTYYTYTISSNWEITNVDIVMHRKLNNLSLNIIPFACLYELALNHQTFYGKMIRFFNCKIIDIVSIKIGIKCFNCNQIYWNNPPKICPNCVINQIIGVYAKMDMIIDDGSAQCMLIKEFNDIYQILNLSKMQYIRLIHSLKDNGCLNINTE